MGREENRREVWVGQKTGGRFGSGRKQEGGSGRIEIRREVWVRSRSLLSTRPKNYVIRFIDIIALLTLLPRMVF